MNRFEDVFRPFLQGNAAQQLMRAPIHHIDAKREKRQITVELHPEQRIPMEEITRVEKQIMQAANLALFEIVTRYRPELFCCESMEDILHELRKRGYPANGIFECSGQKLENGTLTISLRHGGYNLIQQSGCDKAIQHLIGQQYGMAVDVQFDGVLSLDENQPEYHKIIGAPSLSPEQQAALERPKSEENPPDRNRRSDSCCSIAPTCRCASRRLWWCWASQSRKNPSRCHRWTARPVRPPSGEILFARNR